MKIKRALVSLERKKRWQLAQIRQWHWNCVAPPPPLGEISVVFNYRFILCKRHALQYGINAASDK
jgi:hypothetical protein